MSAIQETLSDMRESILASRTQTQTDISGLTTWLESTLIKHLNATSSITERMGVLEKSVETISISTSHRKNIVPDDHFRSLQDTLQQLLDLNRSGKADVAPISQNDIAVQTDLRNQATELAGKAVAKPRNYVDGGAPSQNTDIAESQSCTPAPSAASGSSDTAVNGVCESQAEASQNKTLNGAGCFSTIVQAETCPDTYSKSHTPNESDTSDQSSSHEIPILSKGEDSSIPSRIATPSSQLSYLPLEDIYRQFSPDTTPETIVNAANRNGGNEGEQESDAGTSPSDQYQTPQEFDSSTSQDQGDQTGSQQNEDSESDATDGHARVHTGKPDSGTVAALLREVQNEMRKAALHDQSSFQAFDAQPSRSVQAGTIPDIQSLPAPSPETSYALTTSTSTSALSPKTAVDSTMQSNTGITVTPSSYALDPGNFIEADLAYAESCIELSSNAVALVMEETSNAHAQSSRGSSTGAAMPGDSKSAAKASLSVVNTNLVSSESSDDVIAATKPRADLPRESNSKTIQQMTRARSLSSLSSLSPLPSPEHPSEKVVSLSLPQRERVPVHADLVSGSSLSLLSTGSATATVSPAPRLPYGADPQAIRNGTTRARNPSADAARAQHSPSPEIQIIERPADFDMARVGRKKDKGKGKAKEIEKTQKNSMVKVQEISRGIEKEKEPGRRVKARERGEQESERPRKKQKTEGSARAILSEHPRQPRKRPRKGVENDAGVAGTSRSAIWIEDTPCKWPRIIKGDVAYRREVGLELVLNGLADGMVNSCKDLRSVYTAVTGGITLDVWDFDSGIPVWNQRKSSSVHHARFHNKSELQEWFVERIIGRRAFVSDADEGTSSPKEFFWLVKWDGYPVTSATWEIKANTGDLTRYIADFEVAAELEGHDVDDLWEPTLLNEALGAGWF
ncbi:hypothetical protein WOLCODRAFT_155967 [Wolfiporia cocos MD-104 SS10]|uniref:Chromo domain-containing protein n=1 Tax=Wolfiporia cocos (strain MD-104) TaxID=742152 RepID=A0A2H3IZ58_WOLCO|nr:hypothetical protein WOLCODRAFT_155967 [Wolfiporia cocos MD-104 SS10]